MINEARLEINTQYGNETASWINTCQNNETAIFSNTLLWIVPRDTLQYSETYLHRNTT